MLCNHDEPFGRTVLILDDDLLLARSLVRVLRAHGFTCFACSTADEAIRICREHPAAIDLLLSDVILPGGEAGSTAARARALRDLKVVFMSGTSEPSLVAQGLLKRGAPFIEKPFSTSALLRTIRAALGDDAAGALAPTLHDGATGQ